MAQLSFLGLLTLHDICWHTALKVEDLTVLPISCSAFFMAVSLLQVFLLGLLAEGAKCAHTAPWWCTPVKFAAGGRGRRITSVRPAWDTHLKGY